MKNQYYYAVTRIHTHEADLLTDRAVEQMGRAQAYADCLGILRDHGWTVDGGMGVETILSAQREKTWSFLNGLAGVPDLLNLFRYEYDFSNLKALLKLRYTGKMDEFGGRYLSPWGTLPLSMLKELGVSGDFEALPAPFLRPATEANRLLLQTGNAQLADGVLDRACLGEMHAEADRRDSAVLKQYAETKADIANVSIALRGLRMDQPGDFFALAMTEWGRLSKPALCAAVAEGANAVYAYLETTEYAGCLDAPPCPLSSFQAQAESLLIEEMKGQRYAIGGADPIYAFFIAKENELTTVALLLSSKINHFPDAFVSGRLRRMYA